MGTEGTEGREGRGRRGGGGKEREEEGIRQMNKNHCVL